MPKPMIFRAVDLETTGTDPERDKIVEIAAIDVVGGIVHDAAPPATALVNPHMAIPPEASAVHHIIDADVADAPEAREAIPAILRPDDQPIYVAHNAAFEAAFLKPWLGDATWICTYKCALRLWPEAPNHKNQTLRYWLGLNVERTRAAMTHRAWPDTYVTAHILRHMLGKASITDLLAWSIEPPRLPTCPIGREWRGKPWAQVDQGFLDWILRQSDMDADIVWNAKAEITRRADDARATFLDQNAAARAAYRELAQQVIGLAQSYDDLAQWFRNEEDHRRQWGIVEGDAIYQEIVGWCAARKQALTREVAA